MNVKLSQKDPLRGVDGNEYIHVVTENEITGATSSNKIKINRLGLINTADTVVGNSILEGGIVWLGGMTYYVWAERFIINNSVYNISVNDTLTLSNGNVSNPRFDNFVVTIDTSQDPTTAVIEVLEGTPAASPVLQTIDLVTQAQISFRLVAAGETTDPTSAEDLVYDENVGEPTEWDNTVLAAGGDLNNAVTPYTGAKNVLLPSGASNVVTWKKATSKSFNDTDLLNFAFQIVDNTNSGRNPRVQIKLIDSASSQYWIKTIYKEIEPAYLQWHLFSFKLSEFATNVDVSDPEYDTIEFTFINLPQTKLDWVNIQSNVGTTTPPTYVDASQVKTKDSFDSYVPYENEKNVESELEGVSDMLKQITNNFLGLEITFDTTNASYLQTITSLLNSGASRINGKCYYVRDASTDPDVTSGAAIYKYIGTTGVQGTVTLSGAYERQVYTVAGGAASSGALGEVQVSNGDGTFISDANLHWNNVDKELGVGTSVTKAPITVAGSLSGTTIGRGISVDLSNLPVGRHIPLEISHSSADTNLTSALSGMSLANNNKTNNNYSSLNFVTLDHLDVGKVFGNMAVQFREHNQSTAKADYVFNLMDNTSLAEAARLTAEGDFNVRKNVNAVKFITSGGTANDVVTGNGTLADFAATVRSTILTGLSLTTSTVISATDTVLSALGKLQAQIKKEITADTGTAITLSTNGNRCNGASPNATATFTITAGSSHGDYAVVTIDTTGKTDFPAVTGSTLKSGVTFAADTTFNMYVENDLGSMYHFFLD